MVLCTLWTAVGLDIFKERNEAVNLRLAPMMVQAEKEEGGATVMEVREDGQEIAGMATR